MESGRWKPCLPKQCFKRVPSIDLVRLRCERFAELWLKIKYHMTRVVGKASRRCIFELWRRVQLFEAVRQATSCDLFPGTQKWEFCREQDIFVTIVGGRLLIAAFSSNNCSRELRERLEREQRKRVRERRMNHRSRKRIKNE